MNDATLSQIRAADPRGSSWLSANAGSGKTRVLTDRVARLLLAGADPTDILCLTYTKAAASEMQNRLFSKLGAWAMLDDERLSEALTSLGESPPFDLGRARTLFARAVETPGGLRIQTIHAFCAALLRRFPLEAGVSPAFMELDETGAREISTKVVEVIALDRPDLVEGLGEIWPSDDLTELTKSILAQRDGFPSDFDEDAARRYLSLPPSLKTPDVPLHALSPLRSSFFTELAERLAGLTPSYASLGQQLAKIDPRAPGGEGWALLKRTFLYASGARLGEPKAWPQANHAKARTAVEDMAEEIDDMVTRVAAGREAENGLEAVARTLALHRFAREFLDRYDQEKSGRGLLDFDDLIRLTLKLVSTPGRAEWVLWKIDGGLGHILIDEAQDTSPLQWQLVRVLAGELTSTDAGPHRTIFVVGDKKQSIYSFQGADPDGFDRMAEHFSMALGSVGRPFASRELVWSFRSSSAILCVVDETIRPLSGTGGPSDHRAFREELPGRVDLWPAETGDATSGEEPPWYDPVDRVSTTHPTVRLADRISGEIVRMCREDTIPTATGVRRPVTEGDILILVQGRNRLFHQIIASAKAAGLEVAGADRLLLSAELATKDIVALLSFLALPEDDLSLAAALRSPIFGLGEDDLFRLAAGRKSTLWAALRASADAFPEAVAMLRDLLEVADFMRPFELVQRLLGRHGARARLMARLGPEAEDGIDAFVDITLGYERHFVPSLTGFLDWWERESIEIKRQAGGASGKLRVMTVHGAKGLEAPIVILPDTFRDDRDKGGPLVMGDGAAWLKAARTDLPPQIRAHVDARMAAQEAERHRLLYVAMTRAQCWLIACGAGMGEPPDGSWYRSIENGMRAAGAAEVPGVGLRLTTGDWNGLPLEQRTTMEGPPKDMPDWVDRAAPTFERRPRTIRPSDLGGAKALPGSETDGAEATDRGTRLHLLLEVLPGIAPEDRPERARLLLPDISVAELRELSERAVACIEAPHLAEVFSDGALAEVGITAPPGLLGPGPVEGKIDRLIVDEDRVLAVDFKSNRVVPAAADEVPEGLLRQMGAYERVLSQIYPGRRIETAILWTENANLMPLPNDIVRAALQSMHIS